MWVRSGKLPAPAALLEAFAAFPLAEALYGRRSRRFALGGRIPDGPLAYTSRHPPLPLTELERMLVLTAIAGTTGWHFGIPRDCAQPSKLPNYAGTATGRTFPSAAGFHTSELFFTDDGGLWLFASRDAGMLFDGRHDTDPARMLDAHRSRLQRLSAQRLTIPAEPPYMESHNTWCANVPGSLLVIPVGDVAQHALLGLALHARNGYALFDDVHGREIPGLEAFADLVPPTRRVPLTYFEQYCLSEVDAELSAACFAGVLALQAMGLGGWMYDGIDRIALLGATGEARAPGLGFRFDTDPRWAVPNPTGLPGVFEAFCPPRFPDMAAAVEALYARKYGPGGPFHPDTPGPWSDSRRIRSSAEPWTERMRACVARQAQYVLDTFGKFPGTVPTIQTLTFVQAQHLDTEFYDRHFEPGAYLRTHAEHLSRWHGLRLVPHAERPHMSGLPPVTPSTSPLT